MDYKEFFTSNNKSGWKTKELYLRKGNPEIYNTIINYRSIHKLNSLQFKEIIYLFINNLFEPPKCSCGKIPKFNRNLNNGYFTFCSMSCEKYKETKLKTYKKTCLVKYGIEYSNKGIITKHIDDIIKKYLEGKNATEISRIYDCDPETIRYHLKRLGLNRTLYETRQLDAANRKGLTIEEYIESLPEFKKYRNHVNRVTDKQPIELLLNFEKRGKSGKEGAYHLDHRYSISEGFKNNINPEIIGNIKNLEFITWEENLSKWVKCSITESELNNSITN